VNWFEFKIVEGRKNLKEKEIINIIERYKNTVFKVAYAYCKNRSDADDIFQEVFLRYFKKKPVFADEIHEKAWFIRDLAIKLKDMTELSDFKNSLGWDSGNLFNMKVPFECPMMLDSIKSVVIKYGDNAVEIPIE